MRRRPVSRLRASGLVVVTSGVYLTVALLELKLGSVYHLLLALGLAGLIVFGSRTTDRRQGWLTVALLAYGMFRLAQDVGIVMG